MSDSAMTAPNNALAAKQAQERSFRKKGIFTSRTDVRISVWWLYSIHDTGHGNRSMGRLLWWNRCGSQGFLHSDWFPRCLQ